VLAAFSVDSSALAASGIFGASIQSFNFEDKLNHDTESENHDVPRGGRPSSRWSRRRDINEKSNDVALFKYRQEKIYLGCCGTLQFR
jgi:hypothetical protein